MKTGSKPRICILRTDGTNCDEETAHAFRLVGGEPCLVHINSLRSGKEKIRDYHVLVIPGGFTYGDDVHSGKILAVELSSFLQDQLLSFVEDGKPVLGICNGFQVLVRTGLLPDKCPGKISAALMGNDSGHFECRWVNLTVEKSNCIFTRGMEEKVVKYQVAHGEGKFYTDQKTLERVESKGQVVFRYASEKGRPTLAYPGNPNGSLNAIAGICDETGRVMGLMPHPERYVEFTQHPNWRRCSKKERPHGLDIFYNAVKYAQNM